MEQPSLLVVLDADAATRRVIAATIGNAARITYLADLGDDARAGALATAAVIMARNTALELRDGEAQMINGARLLQFVAAGIDYIPLAPFSAWLPIASNGGAYSEPMAEHAVTLAFAAAKRIVVEHGKLARGEFDQFRQNRMLAGCTCGILGFGGIGVATARLMRSIGLKVHAINRRGSTSEPVDWIGTDAALDDLLRVSDVLVLALPLTPKSKHSIGARELSLMKSDAILINLARGEIIDEAALYAHLQSAPAFTACIDAWWIEPVRHGHFRMDHPFLELPNVIGSPHNSASVKGWRFTAIRRAAENARRALVGEVPLHLVPLEDRMM